MSPRLYAKLVVTTKQWVDNCNTYMSNLFVIFSERDQGERGGNSDSISTSMHAVCDLLPFGLKKTEFNPGRNLTSKCKLLI